MTNRLIPFFSGLLFFLLLASCESTTSSDNSTQTGAATADTSQETTAARGTDENVAAEPTLAAPSCEIAGEVLEGNRVWLQSPDILAVIKADASTAVEGVGPSHRILEILEGRSCVVKSKTTLPENNSPDFPYYIADIQYNNGSNLIGIRGFFDAYICDLDNDYQLSQCTPAYFSEREYDDAQSGMIQRIEVWENYLLGYAQDCGAFAFDLTDPAKPVAVLPFAEWQNPDDARYHSLFLLPSQDGMQGILPFYDAEENAFVLHPLFDEPQKLSTNVAKSARNNQHLVLRNTGDNSLVAIDLGARGLMNPPADVATEGVQAVLAWMKAQ